MIWRITRRRRTLVQGAAGREAQRRIELITADIEVGGFTKGRSRV